MPILQFFANSGFPCPPRRNPSDHFLRCVNSDFDRVKPTEKSSLRHRVMSLPCLLYFKVPVHLVIFKFLLFYLQANGIVDASSKLMTSEIIELLTTSYSNSEHAILTASRIHEISQVVSSFAPKHCILLSVFVI